MGDSVTVTIGQQQGRSATAGTKKSDVDLRFAGCLLHGNSFFLLKANCIFPYHFYILNLIHGLMNTIQQPASDVAMTLIIPPEYYQKTSGLRSLSQSPDYDFKSGHCNSAFSLLGMDAVIAVDLGTHMIAFVTLLFGIQIPKRSHTAAKQLVPIMNANLNVILRTSIPVEMQGSVYSCRNTLQFFYHSGGIFSRRFSRRCGL